MNGKHFHNIILIVLFPLVLVHLRFNMIIIITIIINARTFFFLFFALLHTTTIIAIIISILLLFIKATDIYFRAL